MNSRRLLVDQWSQAQEESQPDDCAAGDLLVSRGLLDPGEWEALVRSAILDALLALAIRLADHPAGTRMSFVPQQVPGAGSIRPMEGLPAWAFAAQEAERLAEHRVRPDACPRWWGPDRSWRALGRQARAVLSQVNGRATMRELAWRNGLALYGMMDWVTRLIQDGVCDITDDLLPPLPRRRPTTEPDGADVRWTPPDRDVLWSVLVGLRRLD